MSASGSKTPSVATGAMVFSLVAICGVATWTLIRAVAPSPAAEAPSCCEVPIEVVEAGRARIGCRGESVLRGCGPLEAGDRVVLGNRCERVPAGMSAGLRLLQGLGVDLNRARAEDLELIDGIGPTLARSIVDHRDTHGPFDSVDALLDVKGIGPKTLDKLRPRVRVSAAP